MSYDREVYIVTRMRIPEFFSTLNTLHSGEKTAIIKSPDTDVFILACHLQKLDSSTNSIYEENIKTRTIFL